jgi:hypothetical protein
MTNMFLSFDFHIEFKPGAANIVADALSRRDTEEVVEVMVLSEVTFKLFDVLRREIDDDPELHALRNEAAAGVRSPKLVVLDSLLTIEGQVYMPPASPCHHVTLLTMQSKAVNKVIAMYLCCLAGDQPGQWLQWFAWAEYCYNTAFHSWLRTTPFCVVYGYDPPSLCVYVHGEAQLPVVHH